RGRSPQISAPSFLSLLLLRRTGKARRLIVDHLRLAVIADRDREGSPVIAVDRPEREALMIAGARRTGHMLAILPSVEQRADEDRVALALRHDLDLVLHRCRAGGGGRLVARRGGLRLAGRQGDDGDCDGKCTHWPSPSLRPYNDRAGFRLRPPLLAGG